MNRGFSVIGAREIKGIIENKEVFIQELIKQTYLMHYQNLTINPNSCFLRYPDKPKSRIIALPAHLGNDINISGVKWIASFPQNSSKNLPRASAILILNDGETGFPFACLESSLISATRTAASAVLAAEHIRKNNKTGINLGIIGSGLLAQNVYKFLEGNKWDISEVRVFDLNKVSINKFINNAEHKQQVKIKACQDVDEVICNSNMIVLSTTTLEPYIHEFSLFRHNPIVLNISLRDLAPEILINSNNVVDDVEHVMNAATSPHLTKQKFGHTKFINGTIAGLIEKKYVLDETKPTIFSPMGMGVLDLALGKYIYDQAISKDFVINIPNFFDGIVND